MHYMEIMQAINPLSALKALGFETSLSGAYIHFPCPKCEKQSVIKAFGDKKNVIYCPHCKVSGHIIKLTMEKKALDWEGAKNFLKDFMGAKKIERELTFEYELQYVTHLEKQGLSRDFCERMGIGRPKGKTMLAGTLAITIWDEEGKRIAYYGMRIKDGKHIYHKSFNPELYLYNYNNIDIAQEVYFCTDIWKCLEIIQKGGQAIYNFGLPYLSTSHTEMLQRIHTVLYGGCETEIRKQVLQMKNYFKFVE